MESAISRPLFVFIDESGDFDFSPSGTAHFVLSAYLTHEPDVCSQRLSALRYEFLARGLHEQVPFHATQNSVGTRKRVIEAMCVGHHCSIHTIWAEKRHAPSGERRPDAFYAAMGASLGLHLLRSAREDQEPIILMFDTALTGRMRSAFLKAIKPRLNAGGRRYHVMFRPVREDLNGQVADYFAWATFRRLESNDPSWLAEMPVAHSERNLFASRRPELRQKCDHPA